MSKQKPHGVLPAVITPFDAGERIDYRNWQKIIDHQISAGVHGLFFAGGQGEFFSLTSAERREIVAECVSMVAGRVPVYMGTGAVTTRESVELTLAAASAGVDYAVVISPYYLKPSQAQLAEHYLAICRESPIPVLAYNIPERTGVDLTPEMMRSVAEQSHHFAGVKDSSGDLDKVSRFVAIAEQIGRDFHVFMGRDHMILPALELGCVGAVAACGNVIPEIIVGLYEAYRRGDMEQAQQFQERIKPLRAAFSMGTFPVVIKQAMDLAGLHGGPCRRPVSPLAEHELDQLRQVVDLYLPARAAGTRG